MSRRRGNGPQLIGPLGLRALRAIMLLVFVVMLVLGVVGPVVAQTRDVPSQQQRHALVAEVDGMINPVTQRFISRAIRKGEKDGAEVVIIKLDTPGGLLSSTRKIVGTLLNAGVPTAVYVHPQGAQAASAGTFITAAGNFAVMSPATNIGAAAPVGSGGEDIPETLKSKVVEDTAALMRTIAARRNRNSEALEETVRNAIAYDATQAVELNVVDFVALNVEDLLRQIDGLTVEIASETGTAQELRNLDTGGLVLREMNMSFIEKFLFFLADPNVSFLLFSLGGLGIVVEFFNPGLIIPGVVGVILLILAFLSFGNLPVNWAAVGFLLLAGTLLVAELFVAGFGILGIGAIVCFIFGGLLLFDSFGPSSPTAPSIKVNLWLLSSIAGAFTLFGIWLLRTMAHSRRAGGLPESPPPSPLIGAVGVAASVLDPRGTVHVAGENWTAMTEDGIVIEIGERVEVLKVEGTLLTVGRVEEGTA